MRERLQLDSNLWKILRTDISPLFVDVDASDNSTSKILRVCCATIIISFFCSRFNYYVLKSERCHWKNNRLIIITINIKFRLDGRILMIILYFCISTVEGNRRNENEFLYNITVSYRWEDLHLFASKIPDYLY